MLLKLQGTELNNLQHEQKKLILIQYVALCYGNIMLPTVITRPCTNQNQNTFQQSKLASFGNWKHWKILNITRFMFLSINNKYNSVQQTFWKLRFLRSTISAQFQITAGSCSIIKYYKSFVYASKLKIKEAKTQAEVKQHGFEKAITVQLSLAF
ncbi:Hypothetical_protein [Hexamita inflata]|uniref:Hypothetical_protein n=1 Tax=Hexamita inflata TaxID=28002 RepID=A0AA86UBY1_9EUKA|nr:Hypothetical protein HINF_LOCUS37229 [Hexamita inflata]